MPGGLRSRSSFQDKGSAGATKRDGKVCSMEIKEGRKRVIIEKVSPEIDGGHFPCKRTVGEKVVVEADIFADGHDLLSCVLLYRRASDRDWDGVPMEPLVNDRWQGSFRVDDMGRYVYTIKAWVDRFSTWRRDLKKKLEAGQEVSMDLQTGVQLVEEALQRAKGAVAKALKQRIAQIAGAQDPDHKITLALEDGLAELMRVVLFWIEQGIRIFRVDNPHTKPFPFWEWLIAEIKRDFPEVIFLAEAFTRPKVMARLAKLGFTQSYTYFAWRNTKWEITRYFQELTETALKDYFRPNLWPNTPDILTEYLQTGGRTAFMIRLVLAATLGASYGIYGPAFELCVREPKEIGGEEYLDSEKYEIKAWTLEDPSSLRDFVARVNRIRKENPALQSNGTLRFHDSDSDQVLCFSKHTEDFSNVVFVVVNLDPHYTHGSWVHVPVEDMGLDAPQGFQVHDLLSDARFLWHGSRNYLELDPRVSPAFVFRVRRRLRTERDFDYFM